MQERTKKICLLPSLLKEIHLYRAVIHFKRHPQQKIHSFIHTNSCPLTKAKVASFQVFFPHILTDMGNFLRLSLFSHLGVFPV